MNDRSTFGRKSNTGQTRDMPGTAIKTKPRRVRCNDSPLNESSTNSRLLSLGGSTRFTGLHREARNSSTSKSKELVASELGPRALVDDKLKIRRFFVRAKGRRREMAFDENYTGITYPELLDERYCGAIVNRSWCGIRGCALMARRAVTWPSILITPPTALLLWFDGRAVYSGLTERIFMELENEQRMSRLH